MVAMSLLRPFQALRPVPNAVREVAAVPYDVVNRDEAAALAWTNPKSFLHVSRAEIDLPQDTDSYSPEVYQHAKYAFEDLIREAPLEQESEPRLYVYRLKQGDRVQTGIAATFSIDEYDQGKIKKHELTRKDKEDDRTRHVLTLRAQTGPVFLTYRSDPTNAEINRKIEELTLSPPLYDFVADDGVSHTVWIVPDSGVLESLFSRIPCLYIADGHHRAASASRARTELRSANPHHTGLESYNFVLAVAFPSNQLHILPYHRVLYDLHGHTGATLLAALERIFIVTPDASPDPKRGEFSLYIEKKWFGLRPRESAKEAQPLDPIAALDVSHLQSQVLEPIFGIRDPRTDQRIGFVGGIRGTKELQKLVDSGQAKAAFSMHPTSLDELMAISDSGGIMPPKSTWFEPKLRDGIVSHLI